MPAGSLTGSLTQQVATAIPAPGTPAGPSGLGGVAPSTPGTGWEIFVRSYKDYTTLLCQIPTNVWTSFQFAKMLDDIGSGSRHPSHGRPLVEDREDGRRVNRLHHC